MDSPNNIRPGEELDWKKLESYLRSKLELGSDKMEIAQFHGGHANLTYLVKFGLSEYVLRRPPFGKIAPGAHDMKREYRVLSKLNAHFSPAPLAHLYTDDVDIIGAPFVLMERRHGIVVRYSIPEVFKRFDNVEERLTIALIKAEAALHTVDVEAADLSKLGRPDGFLQRQLDGWSKRWELSKTEENQSMENVFDLLSKNVPTPQAVSIVHNDIKFDNCQFQPDNPDKITSIFDWDMTTTGDPLVDFGVTLSYWQDKRTEAFPNLPVMLRGDFPDKEFLKEKYQEYSGYSLDQIAWYEALAYWKGAVIAQQLYKRYVNGATQDKRMAMFGESAKALSNIAHSIAETL